MQIVVLDSLPLDAENDLDWSPLRALGELLLYPQTAPADVAERIAHAQIVLTNKVPLSADTLENAPDLKLISVLATGYNIVDVAAAQERGVTVCNVPGYSTPSTAQTTIALLLELCHHVGNHADRVGLGEWTRRAIWSWWDETPLELDGKTLVIIGVGAVGKRVARIAEALGMTVIAAQLSGRTSADTTYPRLPVEEALAVADVVSLHTPLSPLTQNLISRERLSLMKPSALLINTARGPLIDEQALADALHKGRLAGYAADVLSMEPPNQINPLLAAPHCLITPHYAWASQASRARLLAASVKNVQQFLAGTLVNVVT